MKKYNHAVSVAFEVNSNDDEMPTVEECLEAMETRLKYLKENKDEAKEAFDSYDVYENEEE
jgi:hypothetical protein